LTCKPASTWTRWTESFAAVLNGRLRRELPEANVVPTGIECSTPPYRNRDRVDPHCPDDHRGLAVDDVDRAGHWPPGRSDAKLRSGLWRAGAGQCPFARTRGGAAPHGH